MARPSKLTPEVQRKLVALTKAGIFLTASAEYVGVTRPTIYSWLRRGEAEEDRRYDGAEPNEDKEPFVEFAQAIRQARAHANIVDMNVIRVAAQTDPYWAWRFYKLRNPERFRTDPRVEPVRLGGSA